MKKLYITLAVALLSTASMAARELVFYIGNTAITEGETVQFKDIDVTTIGGGQKEVEMAPQLYLYSDMYTSAVKITAKCTSGQSISMCAGGQCVNNTTVVKENIKIESDQKLPLSFDYIDQIAADQDVPEVVTEFEAVDTKHTETLKKFTLVMNPKNGALTVIGTDSHFHAVSGGIEYSFATPTAVELYSITGQKAMSATLEGSGTLATSDIRPGIYIYKTGKKTGKIYIR